MSLAQDLLEQAHHLARRESKRPKQASLRRAVSAAYYALFHLLASEVARRLSPREPAGLQDQMQRALEHGEMKTVCKAWAGGQLAGPVARLVGAPILPELVQVAEAFVRLQQARHEADYDVSRRFTRVQVSTEVERATQAFALWGAVRQHPQATVFLSALLLQGKWRRG